jgi:8-oxo-dGTP pyrophosphatase MutT (NUDIX family)
VVAREAATVVLARDGPAGVEVLLLERHRASPMAPGAYAFPGGRVEAGDAAADWAPFCRGLSPAAAAAALPDVRPPARSLGFWVAALREAFEEAGVLLAWDRRGGPFAAETLGSGLDAHRARCRASGGAALRDLLAERGLALATDRLAYWAHWITPEERPVRYDTRFFVAAAPPALRAVPDGVEVVGARWLPPGEALALQGAGQLTLPAVTREILASVTPFPSAAALLAGAAGRDIRPIRPRIVLADGRERILMPGDPGYF